MGAPKVKAGTVIAGRYRLVAPLSRGGMGSVWRAEHLSLGSPIAIKLIDADLVEHDEPRARFEQEARAAAALRSPHVVQILDHGVDKNLPFIAMELLEGESLAARLHRLKKLPWAQTARIFQDVARAMKRAHDLGIIHRDLKPDNIFLVKNDDQEIAKVLDFGIAKLKEPFGEWKGGGTRTGALIGTPQYMSPEQAQGHPIDHRTDLWALGVIAFECVCGRLPFPSEKPGVLILQICAHPIPVPSAIAQVPPRFDAWFARACQREPAGRFATAKELADALADVLGAQAAPADVSGGFAAVPGPAPAPVQPMAAGALVPAPVVPVGPAPVQPMAAGALVPAPVGPAPLRTQQMGAPVPGVLPAPWMAPAPPMPAPPVAPAPPMPAPTQQMAAPPALPVPVPALPPRGEETINGGAVMDSDPSTLLALRPARVKVGVIAAAAAVVGLAAFGLWWSLRPDDGLHEPGAPVPAVATSPGPDVTTAAPISPSAPAPAQSAAPAPPLTASSSSSPSPSSSSSSTSAAAAASPTSAPAKPSAPATAKPARTAAPTPSAPPSAAASSGKKDPRIGW